MQKVMKNQGRVRRALGYEISVADSNIKPTLNEEPSAYHTKMHKGQLIEVNKETY